MRSLLAMAAAAATVVLVNLAGGQVGDLAGLPGGGESRLAWDLAWAFAAGAAAAWMLVRLAPAAPRAHAAAFFAAMLGVGVLAVMRLGGDWPAWFSAGVLLGVPVQAWVGARWGLRRARVSAAAAAARPTGRPYPDTRGPGTRG